MAAARARSVDELLGDIVSWAGRIERYLDGVDFGIFEQNLMVQDAVIRCLEVLGEASALILKANPQLQDRYPEIELRQAYRARNRTAHGYGSVDVRAVWQSATISAPRLAAAAQKIRDELAEK